MASITDIVKQNTRTGGARFDTSSGGSISDIVNRSKTQTKSTQIKTSKQQELISQSGLTEKFEQKKPKIGEEPNKFLSGGFIMDTFDWLNALSYGTVGVLKGKGFMEGVKTRQSWSDQDALGSKGIPGMVAGIALDIATDPLTYIAPISVLGKFGKATKLTPQLKKAQSAFVKTELGKKLGSALVYRFGQDPVYKQMAERTIKNTGLMTQNITEMAQPLIKASKPVRELFTTTNKKGQTIRRSITEVNKMLAEGKVAKDVVKSYMDVGKTIDNFTKEMVDLDLLPKDVYDNLQEYVNNQFLKHTEKTKKFVSNSKQKIDSSILKSRKDIPDDVREQLGQIMDAGYLLPETAIKMARSIENAKFLNKVDETFGSFDQLDGFIKMPDSKAYGKLSGKYVPEFIQKDLVEMIQPSRTSFEKATRPVVSTFKFGKVILNPATHARNMISNLVLNNFEGMNPLDPRAIRAYGKAIKEIKNKGPLFREAQKQGLGIDTFAAAEIKDLLRSQNKWNGKIKNAAKKVADIYEKEEQWAKMSQYIFQRGKGVTPEEAWKIAERATFNYAQVTPFIRRMRESIFGYPFLTFTYKATPQVARTALKKPGRISSIGKIKEGIEEQVPEEERERIRASQSPWVRDGFYVPLPIKDKEGRTAMLDLTYMLPFGDLATGQFFTRGINSETGFKESPVITATQKLPFVNTLVELNQNQDFFGNKIYKESDSFEDQMADVGRHVFKFMAPPLVGEMIPGGYREDGTRKPTTMQKALQKQAGIDGAGKQTRNIQQEVLRNLGIKINPVDIETQEYWAENMKDKAIETFLKEEGAARGFDILYLTENETTE